MTSRGTAAEGILLKMLLQNGIEAEHGSPSRPGDIIVPPNIIIEIKDPKGNSYSFKQHSAKGEAQWKVLKEKMERFPWLEIYYVVRFKRKYWKFYTFPENVIPLTMKRGAEMKVFVTYLLERQNAFHLNIK
ncbi:MAG: hypothetical protein M1431_04165 [Candidatus Thermoplasmatota archaeon]|nr:hypothetical protein [Candidatus Thermoplasmatota archaeon]